MRAAIAEAKASGVTHIAFGDLFLEDIRDFPLQFRRKPAGRHQCLGRR